MSKISIAVGIITFWISWSIAMSYINPEKNIIVNEFIEQSKTSNSPSIDDSNNSIGGLISNIFSIGKVFFNGIIFFFKSMFLIMPDIPPVFSLVVILLQAISLVLVIFLIRG